MYATYILEFLLAGPVIVVIEPPAATELKQLLHTVPTNNMNSGPIEYTMTRQSNLLHFIPVQYAVVKIPCNNTDIQLPVDSII